VDFGLGGVALNPWRQMRYGLGMQHLGAPKCHFHCAESKVLFHRMDGDRRNRPCPSLLQILPVSLEAFSALFSCSNIPRSQ